MEALLLEREGLEAARAAEAESARAELEAIKQALAGQKAEAARVTATLRDEAERSRILRQLEQRATRRRERRFGARALRLIEAVGEKIGPEAGRVARERRLLAATDLFDPAWYRKTYKDVAESGVDPALHYLLRGNIEGRRPSAAFDGVKYYRDHPSVLAAGENPLIHHLRSGKQGKAGAKAADGVPQNRLLLPKRLAVRVLKSLRNAKFYLDRERYRTTRIIRKSGLFDEDWYLRTYPDVARNGRDPVQHYIEFGDAEQRDPSRTFNAKWYRETYPDVGDSGENTLVHHVKVGKALGRRTMPEAENLPWWLPLKEPRKATAAPAPAWPAEPPAIVVPVYNAAEHVPACLEAIRRNTDSPYRLIVIDDASPDPEIARILLNVRDWPEFEVRRNAENLGFTRTVNLGIALAGSADVVFLNSDTLVTPGWLRNLRHAAYSDPQVGTASPFSNNAGAFSVPEPVVANPLPEWMTLDEYGRAVTQASRRQYPRVPTTNGFCMYVGAPARRGRAARRRRLPARLRRGERLLHARRPQGLEPRHRRRDARLPRAVRELRGGEGPAHPPRQADPRRALSRVQEGDLRLRPRQDHPHQPPPGRRDHRRDRGAPGRGEAPRPLRRRHPDRRHAPDQRGSDAGALRQRRDPRAVVERIADVAPALPQRQVRRPDDAPAEDADQGLSPPQRRIRPRDLPPGSPSMRWSTCTSATSPGTASGSSTPPRAPASR